LTIFRFPLTCFNNHGISLPQKSYSSTPHCQSPLTSNFFLRSPRGGLLGGGGGVNSVETTLVSVSLRQRPAVFIHLFPLLPPLPTPSHLFSPTCLPPLSQRNDYRII
jgi:hypothetical protein